MAQTRPSLSPLKALGIGVLLLASAQVVGTILFSVGVDQYAGPGPLQRIVGALATFVRSGLFAAILLGGIYAALTLERFERPLLVVLPVVFGVAFLFTAGVGLLVNSVEAALQLSTAVSSALYQTAVVAAVTIMVRAIGLDDSGAPSLAESLAD